MTIKQKIKKVFYKIAHPILRSYWFIFRPQTRGVKCLIENNNKFLLVRLNYAHRRWAFPGGGVGKKESFSEAAAREAKEETGIEISNPIFIGRYKNVIEYKNDTVEVYLGQSKGLLYKIDPVEIKEAQWFSRDFLPDDRMPRVDMVFKLYDEYKSKQD